MSLQVNGKDCDFYGNDFCAISGVSGMFGVVDHNECDNDNLSMIIKVIIAILILANNSHVEKIKYLTNQGLSTGLF